jgi:hypothetical protein
VGKYVLAYRGGGMAETEEAQAAVMNQWMAWFGELGASVVDGGNPFGPSKKLASDGKVADGNDAGLTGYSIIDAASLDEAAAKAKDCPVLSSGGTIDVYETIAVG